MLATSISIGSQACCRSSAAAVQGTPRAVRCQSSLACCSPKAQPRHHFLAAQQQRWTGLAKPSARHHSSKLAALGRETGYDVITSEADFAQNLQQSDVVVVDWMAKWCRKCIYLKPKLEKLVHEEFPDFGLMFVDVNAVPVGLVTGNGIRKMPTIAVYRNGEKVNQHIAAEGGSSSLEKIREMLKGCQTGAKQPAQ